MSNKKYYTDGLLNWLFIDKVERLKKNRFLIYCLRTNTFPVRPVRYEDVLNFPRIDGVARQSIDSFILHFRFLIQPRDNISFEKTFERLNKSGFVSEKTKKLINEYEKYTKAEFGTPVDGRKVTSYYMFETIFYGGLAHYNSEKVIEFLKISSNPIISGLGTSFFFKCVRRIFAICKSLEVDIKKYEKNLIPKK